MYDLGIFFSHYPGRNDKLIMALMGEQIAGTQRQPAYVRFQNNTCYRIEINWINYQKKEQTYCILDPKKFVDANTFSTHKWVFRFANVYLFFVICTCMTIVSYL